MTHRIAMQPASISAVPAAPGAYRLYLHGRVVYVGIARGAATLRSELRRHLRGDFGELSRGATELDYAEATDEATASALYVEFFMRSGLRHGSQPAPIRCRGWPA
jgi:hypothetical protein